MAGPMDERRKNFTKRERFETLRVNLLERLRRVTADMPQRELERLTAAMTRLRLKYEPWSALPEQDAAGRGPLSA